ncbi:MAG: AAA family ATPase, partial [Pirellulaceae bacterium]|nr:AAA family ATPase [Pirellulaceae bacterium]
MNETSANDSFISTNTPIPASVSARLVGGRYRVVKLLKKERAAEHFLAEDTHGDLVVVSCRNRSNLTADTRQRIEREAEILQDLQSPSLARVLDIGQDGNSLYIARSHIPGVTLSRRLLDGPLDLQDALAVGQSLFSALVALHSQGILHHDVRPATLIVDDKSPLHRAVLTDFSINCCFLPKDVPAKELLEAATYRSPEYAGALKYEITEASDLYSAGIVLFECLAGQPPFSGNNVGDTLLLHMTSRVPELRNLGVRIPRAFDELVQRLLHKDPRDRYQSAEAVLMDLNAIMEAVQSGMSDLPCVVGCHDHRTTLTEPAFVGRQDELEQVEKQIRQVAVRQEGLVFLEAESGGGKTRFLAEVASRGAQANMWVLHGCGLEMVGGRPFQVLHGIVEDVVAEARSNPSFAATLRKRLGDHADAVGAVLPELARSLGWKESAPVGPEGFAETWSIQALAAFLDALGSEDRPAMVILDDCQWADATTVKLIAHWRRKRANTAETGSSTLLIVAFRSEEVAAKHPLRMIRPSLHLRLALLEADEIRHLLESMAGPLPAKAIEVVYRLSEGSPFMASAVLRGMVESGALLAKPAGWVIEPNALADLHSSNRAAGFLSRRIELLPQDTLELLTIGSVLGKEFDLNLAAKFLSLSTAQAIATLDTARERHLVWLRPKGAECIFVHDMIRDSLLARITPEIRQDLHLRVARHLQQEDVGRIFDLAYHYDAGGDCASALPYALQAAKQARAQYALETAESQYRIALRGADSGDRATRYEIAKELGDVLMLRGHYGEAEEVFQIALGLVDGTLAEAEICGKLGELDFKRGDMVRAALSYQKALRLLGKPLPQNIVFYLLTFLWESAIQTAHTWFPRLFVSRRNRTLRKTELLRLQLRAQLAYAYFFTRGKVKAFSAHLADMNFAELHAPSLELARIYSSHAMAMTLVGWYSRGLAYAWKSLLIRRSLGDLWGQGQSLSFYGCILYAASRFNECIDKCREAKRLLERAGDRWEWHIAIYQVAASLYRLGDMQGAVQVAKRMYKSGLELGDEQASSISLDVWARATLGKVPEDILAREVNRKRPNGQTRAQVLLAQGVQLTESGRHEQAVAVFEEGIANGKPITLISAYAAPNLAWLATALRRWAESESQLTPTKREKLLNRAETAARRAIRVGLRLPNDLPHALREYAHIRALRGKIRRSCGILRESLAIAKRQGAKYEYAQTLLIYHHLRHELGYPGEEEKITAAEAALKEMAVSPENAPEARDRSTPTLSLVDRFDTVLEVGHNIASALSPAMIYSEVQIAATRLLRGEHCSVLEIIRENGAMDFRPISGSSVQGFRVARLLKAMEAKRAITFSEAVGGESTNASVAMEDRSALCVPILARGRAAACIYVAHEHVHGLFGPDEERLADFIATIAGAAMENAEGFQQLQDLNATLEVRVAERTAAAEARARELAISNRELELLTTDLRRTEEQLRIAKEAA